MDQIREILQAHNVPVEIREFPQSTHTAAEAAAAIGCDVAQIAKSLIFRTIQTNQPVLVIASGMNRVDLAKVSALVNEEVVKADADFVKAATGISIGGVAPFGFPKPVTTLLDEDLLNYAEVWAAAGTAYSVFKITPTQLLEITQAKSGDIKE